MTSDVLDFETTSLEVFVELGLLSESEFESMSEMSGFSGAFLKAELVSLPSQFGGSVDKKYFLVTLDGFSCSEIHAMRRIKVSHAFGLSRKDILLSAAKQVMEGQGKAVFEYHAADQLSRRPKRLAEETAKVPSFLELKEKAAKAKLASKQGEPCKVEESSSDPEADPAGPGEKKLKAHTSGRLATQRAPKKKAAAPKSVRGGKNGAKDSKDREEDDVEDISQVPQALSKVVESLRSTPRCFTNLDIGRILSGERLMRSVDAAAT